MDFFGNINPLSLLRFAMKVVHRLRRHVLQFLGVE